MLLKEESSHDRTSMLGSSVLQDQLEDKSRLASLVEMVDLCTSAKQIADSLGDTFLAYMLSMSIQAARAEMRPKALRAYR